MTAELGQLALALAFALSLAQAAFGLAGPARGDRGLQQAASGAAIGVLVFAGLAFATLIALYLVSDFSVRAVAENSHTAKPLLYKFAGAWGNHEGSMLLWVFVLALVSAAMALARAGSPAMTARALGVQGLVGAAFLAFVLFTSDPFTRIDPPPFEGAGLNPLLQDPGLAFHPPFLYLGYVGLSAAFAYAAAALIAGDGREWARAARPFALVSWVALTIGIALGSWWAYYELGWGGFWFWDPVENASLMPWLIATALVHSLMATARTGAFKSWTLLLAILAFAFSLIGTFLVRSGVLTSVHAFANDPERGLFILAILVAAVGGAFALYALRAPKLAPGAPFEPASRETALLLNNLLLTAAAAAVAVGTLYPLALEGLTGARISVGGPYFTLTFAPIAALLAVVAPFGPFLGWRKADPGAAFAALRPALGAGLAAGALALVLSEPWTAAGIVGMALGAWLVAGAAADAWRRSRLASPLSAYAAALAHAGFGIVVLGVVGATVWKSEAMEVLAPGQSLAIAGYELRLEGVDRIEGPNYRADRAELAVFANGARIAAMTPEKRFYPAEGQVTTEAAIRSTGFADLYAALGDARGEGRWTVRAYFNPLAPFIWMGALVMALGGLAGFAGRLRAGREAGPEHAPAPAE